ncbi:MAG: ABC transporter ATP-binding protein [Nitrososphaerota archaeon]
MIKVRGLSFSYGGVKVLEDISFEVDYGEFVGVIGPNGSGKTTLLKCLCRLLKPLGVVYLDGEKISEMTHDKLARLLSYISSENDSSVNSMTVFDIVSTGRTPYMKKFWWESVEDEEIIFKSIEIVGLKDLYKKRVGELSSGEKQMVKIARALSQSPKIFLVDEPTVHLDLKHQLEVMNILKNLTVREGKIVIAVLHDLNLASIYADKILVLNNGRIIAQGKPYEVLREELLGRVYGVKVRVIVDSEFEQPIIIPYLGR